MSGRLNGKQEMHVSKKQGHARDTEFHVLGIQGVHNLVLQAFQPRLMLGLGAWVEAVEEDDEDVYYPRGRRPREYEEEEESYEKHRQRHKVKPGKLA